MRIRASSQIDYLRDNISTLTKTCEPFWHPLGFVSCVIRDEPDCRVRVHYWPKGERRPKKPDWPIHTHVYDLSSLVLMGRVRDMQYREKIGSDFSVYSVSYSGDDSSITNVRRKLSVDLLVNQYHVAGEEYSIPVGSFHQTYVPEEESAVTLVALSNFQHTEPLVLGTPGDQSYPYIRTPFDNTRFWTCVDKAVRDFVPKVD